MPSCQLHIGDRIVVESADGPLEAEYALFDAGDIELQSDGPASIREVGYRTTAEEARKRLHDAGVTPALAEEAGAALTTARGTQYARGPEVQRVAAHLGPYELFESRSYDAASRQYAGTWFDVAALARATQLLRASTAIQSLFLASLLSEVGDATPLFLSTVGYTRERRPGERTFRRIALGTAIELPRAFRGLVNSGRPGVSASEGVRTLTGAPIASGPTRIELLDMVNARAVGCANPTQREHLGALARALTVRTLPPRGPLSDSGLWALEAQLAQGDTSGVLDKLDAIERARGRLPGTIYLRARVALLLGTEPPRALAEKLSELSVDMNTFFELELLAAEAWTKAGDLRKARAFARDLVENPSAPDDIRIRALEIVDTRSSDGVHAVRSESRELKLQRLPSRDDIREGRSILGIDGPTRDAGDDNAPDTRIDPTPIVHVEGGALAINTPPAQAQRADRASFIPSAHASAPPASLRENVGLTLARFPPLDAQHPLSPAAPSSPPLPPPPALPAAAPPFAGQPLAGQPLAGQPLAGQPLAGQSPMMDWGTPIPRGSTRPVSASFAPPSRPPRASAAPPDADIASALVAYGSQPARRSTAEMVEAVAVPAGRISDIPSLRPPDSLLPVLRNAPLPSEAPPDAARRHGGASAAPFHAMGASFRGASQPPYQTAAPEAIPRPQPSIPPRGMHGGHVETAEHLSLPPGLHGQPPPPTELPKTAVEARIAFTHASRELGREYRIRFRTELRTDVPSIEVMQRHLRERFADGHTKTPEDMYVLRLHASFLTEILARQLGAYWVDIGPTELGYWAMLVPPTTRIIPFGRVLRFVQMGHKERDLVSYYLELESRSRQ